MENWNVKLSTASWKGDIEDVKICLENKADIDYQDDRGVTALMSAANGGHLEICRLLIDRGCKIDTTTGWGDTALMYAAREGRLEICRLLIDRGCKIDITGDRGVTALMWAAMRGHLEICRLLIDTGCKIDITDRDGETALHWAAERGHLQITRCLVERGASPLVTTHEGKTPYDLAAAKLKFEVVEYLQTVMSEKSSSVPAGPKMEAANKGTLRALYDYDARAEDDLSFKKGDLLFLLDENDADWWFARHSDPRYTNNKNEGYVPRNYVAKEDSLYAYEWFMGAFSRKETERLLLSRENTPGSYLIRESETSPDSVRSAMLDKLLGSGSYESFDMRCMVTGQFAVGKSSLVKLLVGDNVPEGRQPTDGISLIEGRCGLDIETRSWIMIDPATYNALDVVYNKVLMTSEEEDESKQTKTPKKPESDAKPVDSPNKDDTHSQKSEATRSTDFPVNLSTKPSIQPQAAQSLSLQMSSGESKRQQMKKKMTTKMTKKEIRKRMEKVLKSGKYKMKVGRLIFWDFGGQYVYYTTHQTFMTFRALFLVVFDGSKRLNEEVTDVLCFPGQHMTPTPAVFLLHWVNSILTYCKVVYAGIPKILFVATHKDKIPVEDVETRRALLYREVEELFKDHEGRNHLVLDKQIFVNATDKADQEIEDLKKAITELTFDHPCWGERMPNAWVPLELEIAELVAAGKQILSLDEVEELNTTSKVSVLDLAQLHEFLHFQHSLGKIVYIDTQQLRDYVIINPLLMVEVMRSFVTDKVFWPKKRRMQEIFRRMSDSGIICRGDMYSIWDQKDFRAILPYKEFIFNILIYLDILAEQRRYDIASGMRLPVENYFVPCMVTERNTSSFMVKECKPGRAICLAFVFKGTVIPPALPNRLISACLSMWSLKQYEGRKLLFSGFIVVSFDKAHDIVVCVEGNKILLYIVHTTSAGLIVPDIATGVKECLVTTMERISDFYQSTIHINRSQQLPFHIEYSCSELKCFINEEEALQTDEWVCDKHHLTHRVGFSAVWNQAKKIEQCEQNCQGLSDDALNQKPSDIELLRLSIKCSSSQMYKLVTYLEMSEKWDDIQHNYQNNVEVAKFLVLSKWKEMKVDSKFRALAEALTNMDISTHILCQVRRVKRAEHDIPVEYLDCIPTDEILDALAPQIGQIFFQLGAEIGLSIANLENIQSNNYQDLAAQNKEVLFIWREDRTVKPTLQVLVQALVNVGRGAHCLQEVLKNVDLNTLRGSKEVRGRGAIPKKLKNTSEQKPHSQKKGSKKCSIA